MSEHVMSPRTYLIAFTALMVLLGATFAVDALQLGRWSFAMSMGIAVAKAALIGVYFMHLRFSSALTRLVALGSLLWLAILLTFTLGDYAHRARAGGTRAPQRAHASAAGERAGSVPAARGDSDEELSRDGPLGDSPGRSP
jgi:cytochrome c oxidase subunit IV